MTCEIEDKSPNVKAIDSESESRKPSRGEIRLPKNLTSKDSPQLLLVQSRYPGI